MTVAIALAHEGGVTIGSDRASCAGSYLIRRDQPKWFVSKNGLSVASSGVAAMQHIIESEATSLLFAENSAGRFCEELRSYLRDEQRWEPTKPQRGSAPEWEAWLLITDGERVWETDNTLYPSLAERGEPAVIGSGYEFALGAMHAARSRKHPWQVVTSGLSAAIRYDVHCGGEPWVKTITKAAP